MAGARNPGPEGLSEAIIDDGLDGLIPVIPGSPPGPIGVLDDTVAESCWPRFDVKTGVGRIEIAPPAEFMSAEVPILESVGAQGTPTEVQGERHATGLDLPEHRRRRRVEFSSSIGASRYLSSLLLSEDELSGLNQQVQRVAAMPPLAGWGSVIEAAAQALVLRELQLFHTPLARGGGGGKPQKPDDPDRRKGKNVDPPKPRVGPVIVPSSVIVVVKKFHKTPAGKTEPYTSPKRRSVVLSTDSGFDGTGTFTRSSDTVLFFKSPTGKDEIKFDGSDNVFQGADLTRGITVYAEANKPSGAMNDVKLTLTLNGGSKSNDPPANAKATAVEVTLDICTFTPVAGGEGAPLSSDDKIDPGRPILIQNTDKTRDRALLIIRQVKPNDYPGDVVLKPRAAGVTMFAAEKATAGESALAQHTMPAPDITAAGKKFWAEGSTASTAMRDTGFQLGLAGLEDDADHVNITVVDAVLDICKSRSKTAKEAADPDAMSADDKLKVGRFVHEQDGSFHHGRAMLVLRELKPKDYSGTLVLDTIDAAKAELFANEVAKTGDAAIACPHDMAYPAVKNVDHKFWVQGKAASGALRDAGFRLFLKGDRPPNSDEVRATVVQFTDLKVDIPSTAANQVRNSTTGGASNSPVARHALTLAGGAANAKDYDHSYATNIPVVLIEGSVRATDQINLSVTITPAAAAPFVSWSSPRDTRSAAPKGDADAIVKLAGNSDDPGLVSTAAKPLEATLTANAVGSFHVQPYIDNNGSGKNEFDDAKGTRIDREPYICLNLVLVRVQGMNNLTVTSNANGSRDIVTRVVNYFGTGNLTVPRSVATGNARGTPPTFAIMMKVVARVIGGGPDGLRGLDQVFAGWCNNELNAATSPGPGGLGEDVTHTFRARAPGSVDARTRCLWRLDGAEVSGPMLDSGYTNQGTGGNTCTGTAGRNSDARETSKVADPSGIGQRWTVTNGDPPGGGILLHHPADNALPAASRRTLRNFKFNLDWRCALLFWTNRDKDRTDLDRPSCRLYSSVSENTWSVRLESSFDDNFVETRVVRKTVAVVKDPNEKRLATPVDGSRIETRLPDGLNSLVTDVPFP